MVFKEKIASLLIFKSTKLRQCWCASRNHKVLINKLRLDGFFFSRIFLFACSSEKYCQSKAFGKQFSTHLLLVSWKPPSSSRIFAKSTALRNGTSIISSRLRSTQNLYFFFFIINAIPGALGPSNVINKFKSKSFSLSEQVFNSEFYHLFLIIGVVNDSKVFPLL